MGNKEEKNNTVPNGSMEITGRRHKSARPGRISYVPISDEDLAPYEPPVRKKHKGLKITGIAVAMVIVSAGAAYAGMSYYYSDKFFEGTSINGIDCSGKTAYEAERHGHHQQRQGQHLAAGAQQIGHLYIVGNALGVVFQCYQQHSLAG